MGWHGEKGWLVGCDCEGGGGEGEGGCRRTFCCALSCSCCCPAAVRLELEALIWCRPASLQGLKQREGGSLIAWSSTI